MEAATRISLAVVLLLAIAACGCQRQDAAGELTAQQQSELGTFTSQLADPSRSFQTKLEAAEMLLSRPYPQASESLEHFLTDSANPSAQLAVAEAIASRGGGKMFVDPLLSLLKGDNPPVRAAAGRALAAYDADDVTEQLIDVAADKSQNRPVRLAAIRSLAGVQHKQAVAAMIDLIEERDTAIQQAAAESLAKLTSIRSFGADRAKWRAWWADNKHKRRAQWLAELAERLGKSLAALEAENTALRERLAEAIGDVYEATPPAQREAMLLDLLKDPTADIRLVGAGAIDRRLAGNEAIGDGVRLQIRGMLVDGDARCRRAAALLVAHLGDGDSLRVLLDRMKVESDQAARQALLAALGQLRQAEALPAVLAEIPSPADEVATAAAEAMARIAEDHPLSGWNRARAAKVLTGRYRAAAAQSDGAKLREALLTAMGTLGDRRVVEVVHSALKDRAATVRLAAVGALGRVGNSGSAPLLSPLVADGDRGVRQAAISVLGGLAGQEHLQTILQRTDASVETDAAVRREAWQTAMSILAKADAEVLRDVAESLAERSGASDERIEILKMLTGCLTGTGGPAEGDARRQLGLALMQAGRPAEAGPYLEQAWRIHQARQGGEALDAWYEWIDALLAADDPASIKAIKGQADEEGFASAMIKLDARLSKLKADGNHSALLLLAEACLDELSDRMTADRHQTLEQLLEHARSAQMASDRLEVSKLVMQLQGVDEAARTAALSRLAALGQRAAAPLLLELKKILQAEDAAPEAEAVVLAAIAQVAPDFSGYDPAAEKAEKIKLIDEHLDSGSRPPGDERP